MADKLAKEATEEDTNIEVPVGDFRKEFKLKTWNITQDTIDRKAQFKGKIYLKNFYDGKNKKPWLHKVNAKRYSTTLINKIRENQYNLNESLARKGYIALDAIAATKRRILNMYCGNVVDMMRRNSR